MSGTRRALRVITSIAVIGGLSVGTGAAFLNHSLTTTDVKLGPTAASLNDAFSQIAGTALGLAAGTAIFACLAWQDEWVSTGLAIAGLEGIAAYLLVVTPVFVFTGASDVSHAELLGDALLVLIPMIFVVLAGVIIGGGTGAVLQSTARRGSRPPSGDTG